MIWVDREVKKIKERKLPLEWVDDMKTPSGRIHVGALRGVLIYDLVYKVLAENNVKAEFSYVFENHDPMDALPAYLDKTKWEKYMGRQLYEVPSPEPGFKNFAEYYAKEFQQVFESINCHPKIIWAYEDLYQTGKMNAGIKKVLDGAVKIREIYHKITKKPRPADWFPFNAKCENCQKIGTTQVYKWDGQFVYYRCLPNLVDWATGCGHSGKVSPFNGAGGKIPWKVEWAAKWQAIGVTIEGAGKDHMSKGGSYDIASAVCKEILDYPPPYPVAYEWFTIGGRKMSSSKGIGSSAKEVSEILPPDVFRFLIVRSPIERAIDFNPEGETLPNLFDDFDRCLNAYFNKVENKILNGKLGEVMSDFARIIELSTVKPLPKKRLYLPRFRTLINLLKNKKQNIVSFFEGLKQSKLTEEEKNILEERIKYAKIYLNNSVEEKVANQQKVFTFNEKQREFLKILAINLGKKMEDNQKVVFESIKQVNIAPKEAFSAFYLTLTEKSFGPKAGDLINQLGINKVIALIKKSEGVKETTTHLFPTLNQPEVFSIDRVLAKKYPSINIGIAIIKGITIKKNGLDLKKKIDEFVNSQTGLTNEIIGSYPEIQSYRKAYKEMGIDWHSKRPSPEALLRRIALGKDLYQINTCVDACNLIVMKHRVSCGVFDLDKMKLPTVLRFPKKGEEILLLGDKELTKYKPIDLAYFDQIGGYNIYFNYRDAVRTAVSEETKNIILNIDGIFTITRNQVERSLNENIEIITKYCGGKVEIAGIVSAA